MCVPMINTESCLSPQLTTNPCLTPLMTVRSCLRTCFCVKKNTFARTSSYVYESRCEHDFQPKAKSVLVPSRVPVATTEPQFHSLRSSAYYRLMGFPHFNSYFGFCYRPRGVSNSASSYGSCHRHWGLSSSRTGSSSNSCHRCRGSPDPVPVPVTDPRGLQFEIWFQF